MTVPIPREPPGQGAVTPPWSAQRVTTTKETLMTSITTTEPIPAVRWEPCEEFHPDTDDVCAGCGWAADDHGLADAA
jgi:hypothetical protein